MKESLLKKLERLAERLQERDALLADPATINDQKCFRELSKEHAEIRPVVSCFHEYQKILYNMKSLEGMLKDTDKEMRELASEELAQAREKIAQQELELQRLWLPKDPADT